VLFALGLPRLAGAVSEAGVPDGAVLETLLYLLVAAAGWAVGAEFPLGTRLYGDAGGGVGNAAAVMDAWDHTGAAVGALAAGVLLLPVLGIGGTCAVLGGLKGAGLLLAAAMPRSPGPPCYTGDNARCGGGFPAAESHTG
ncbi:MAG: hypothetical protein JW951_01355, partial [Lentisphaerae bacterium]|nr:hypothetical protein [Lentisphaerota bacterium]